VDGAGPVGCAIAGLPGHPVEDVALENIRLEFEGGGKRREEPVPEYPDKYPEFRMFGPLPAYGFYCRHVRGIRFRDVRVRAAQPDERPRLVCEDVEGRQGEPT
jgi:hypothetical protein